MTDLFAVVGHPISHSLSPVMHNAVFEKLGLDCRYILRDINPEELGNTIIKMRDEGYKGVNVTIPHKVRVIEHLDRLSKEAEVIGAVNTIKIDSELTGFNTDGVGALYALKNNGADPEGKRVLILGSGGAARAISITLALRGGVKDLTILGQDAKELERLTVDIESGAKTIINGALFDEVSVKDEVAKTDILIHATPVGMHPNSKSTILTADELKHELVLMDIVYNPLETQLIKEAKQARAKTIIGGVEMFVNQGAEALRIWLGIEPPIDFMKKTVLKELK